MERYCGRLQRCIKSRRFPFANIDTFVVADARLKQLGFRWHIANVLTLKHSRIPLNSKTTRFAFLDVSCLLQNPLDYVYSLTQSLVDDSDTCVVAPPYRGPSAVNDAQLIRRVQVSLATRFDTTLSVVRRFVPDRPQNLALYGKVRRLGAGDTIWASSLTPGAEDRSDASWVRVSCHMLVCMYIELLILYVLPTGSTKYLLTAMHDTGIAHRTSRRRRATVNYYTLSL